MRVARTIGSALLIALALSASSPSVAHARVGVVVGVPLGPWLYPAPYYDSPYPYYPYAPYAYPPAFVVPPSGYVEQAPSSVYATPPAPSVYYYCPAARAYYPYVRDCPGGWERVPAVPQQ